jgi:hypothetical protein
VSSNRLVLEGIAELRDALRRLPHELKAEAQTIVEGAADSAARDIKAGYPERSGKLRRGVSVRKDESSTFGAGAIVVNRSPHAWMFENGTQARHTAIGANRGAMPPGHVFIPIAIRKRKHMYEQLRGLLERHGLKVTGSAG